MGHAQGRYAERVVVLDAGEEASDAGHRRAHQQDGADRLGGDDTCRGVPVAVHCDRVERNAVERVL